MVGDGINPPFVDNCADYCITSGVLSNFPDSPGCCQSIYRMLKVGGQHLALENNKSIFRLPFDIMNKFFSIWKNVKGKEPEMDLKILKKWYKGTNIEIDSQSFCYLPPQAFSREDTAAVRKRLHSSNKFFRSIGMGSQGGLFKFKVKKV
jgi:ubiquinone/menaquinone biosynthesis C-methylase UbiE